MRLLVVTPTLGSSRFLRETVESVAALGTDSRHVLVCPNDAAEILRHDHPKLEVEIEDAPGLYNAVNHGAALATDWRWLTWINDDDLLEPGFRSTFLAAAPLPAGMQVVYGDVRYLDNSGRNLGRLPIARPEWIPAVLARGRAPFTQQGTLISRELWDRLGGFDTRWRLAADFDFWCRAVVNRATFHRVAAIVASFRLHGRQLSADQDSMSEEIAAICSRHRAALRPNARAGARFLFRLASLARILERRSRSGVWTSRALYARYSKNP